MTKKAKVEYSFLRCEIPKTDHEYLKELADASDLTLSQLIRQALKPYLVNKPKTKPEGMDELMWISSQRSVT